METEMNDEWKDFPKPGTPEWGKMNQRRWLLIQKEHREGLSEDERVELDTLQSKSLRAVEGYDDGEQD